MRAPVSKLLMCLAFLAVTSPVTSVAWAERVALLPASGVNINEGTLEAAQDILRGELTRTGRFQVAQLPGPVGKVEASPDEAVGAARGQGADLGAVLHITRLGNVARLRLTAYAAATGQMVYTDELPAASPDDMPPVLTRLAKGMATGKSAADNADIETVTATEAGPLRKRRATSVFGVELGYQIPLTDPYEGGEQLALPGMAIFWLYDARSFLADVSVGFHTDGGDGDYFIGLGAYYPFSRGDVTPYLGGGFRYGHSEYGGEGGSGMVGLMNGGLIIGRLSTVQVRAEVGLFFNLFKEYASDGRLGDDTRSMGLCFNLGLGF